MATYIKRKTGWLAQIRRKGHDTICRTFDTKAEAERWAIGVESKMGDGRYEDTREALTTTLSECLSRYESEVLVPSVTTCIYIQMYADRADSLLCIINLTLSLIYF